VATHAAALFFWIPAADWKMMGYTLAMTMNPGMDAPK
jgi:hypothetical protein